jgi:hypothetical protein
MLGRASAVLCALLVSSVHAFGADATGVFRPTCESVYQYLLDITTFRGHRLGKPIQLQVLGEVGLDLYPKQWVDSPRNDDIKSSRIQVLHLSHHGWRSEMSGNFEIVFGDGRKLEGSFKAKYVKPLGGPLICE